MSASSQPSSSLATANLSVIFDVALNEYKSRTGQDVQCHPFAIALGINNSPDAILEIFRRQAQALDIVRQQHERLMACLSPIINILFTFSAALGEGIGLAISPAGTIFTGIGILLGTAKGAIASYEKLVQLFERVHYFLQRLDRYTGIPLPPDMIDLLGKIMAQVLSVLAYSTREMKESRTKKFLKRLVGRTDVEDALDRLDILTKEENSMTAARNLEVAHRVNDNVKENMKLNHLIIHKVTAVQEGVTLTKHVIDETQRNQLREKLITWLAPPDPSINHSTACDIQHKGTASWFLEGDTFNEWKKNGSVLWIRGNPGSGKTVLCSAIIEDVKRMRESCLILYYYFDFKVAAKRDVRGLLTFLLKQLVQRSDHCWDILCRLYESRDDKSEQPSEATLTNCLKAMLELPGRIPVFIILDALDECPNFGNPSAREKVLNFLEGLIGSNYPNLHICITSRPEHDILFTLEPLIPASRRVALNEEDGQTEDINNYIRSFVHTNKVMRKWKTEDKELVISALTNRAGGMFRWVYCQLDSLSQCFPSSIRNALLELPTTLDGTYERILQGIPKQKRHHAFRLFQCMIAAFRPLRVEELAEMLAFKFDLNAAAKLVEGWRPENPEEDVLSTCSTLIAIIDDDGAKTVQFSHFSVKEFLTSDRLRMSSKDGDICEYYIPLEPAHAILVRACLAVLLQLDEKVDKKRLAAFPLASYAAHHWVDHAKFGNVTAEIQDVMENLFNPNKPHLRVWAWIFDVRYEKNQTRNFSGEHPLPLQATPLLYAAVCGFSGLAEHLIVVHAEDVNAKSSFIGSPLHAASSRGHTDAACVILAYGAYVNARGRFNWTPLHCASDNGHIKVVQLLLEQKADITAEGEDNDTPLFLASEEGHLEVVELLLAHGANVNARGQFNWTPLHCASCNGHIKVAQLLLEQKADITAEDKDNDTPLFLASQEGHFEMVELLLAHGADVNARGQLNWTPLHCASFDGHIKVVQLLLEQKADITAEGEDNDTPLFLASRTGHFEVVELLLAHGADVNARGQFNWTPLHCASCNGHIKVVQLLLEQKADITAEDEDEDNDTPLILASQDGHFEVVELLLAHGADVNARGQFNWTPLHSASLNGHIKVVQLLIEQKADITAEAEDNHTPLFSASEEGHSEVVELLLAHGADVNSRDQLDRTPLHYASQEGHVDVVRLLLRHGADANIQGSDGLTPFQKATEEGHHEISQLLLEHDAKGV